MAFIITHSSIEDATFEKMVKLEEPKVRRATEAEAAELLAGKGTHFKLYDDDSILYFTGKFLGDPDSEEAFEPLEWAESYAGCTSIKYRQADGTYATL